MVLSQLALGIHCLVQASSAPGPQFSLPQIRENVRCKPKLKLASVQFAASAASRAFENDNAPGAPEPETLYKAFNLSVPVDHFHNDSSYEPHSNGSFPLRYWYDDRFYKPGGPVIALASGGTSGEYCLGDLQKGIIAILAEATNGVGVILEHRYYGRSYPTRDYSTKDLRFLTTDQALADTAYFAQHIAFPGKLTEFNLTAPGTPWIFYGGSYAGAFVAFLRKVYPEIFWGAISSSGVTAAIVDYWEYNEAARFYSPKGCAETTQKLTHIVDNILLQKSNTTKKDVLTLKKAFGLQNLTGDVDFAYIISGGISELQYRNWDPASDGRGFLRYCGNLTSSHVIWPGTENLDSTVRHLLKVGGYEDEIEELVPRLKNYIGYVNFTTNDCLNFWSDGRYAAGDLTQLWRPWRYQKCTQWGYFVTGSGVPDNQLSLISRLIDIDYRTRSCRKAFNITDLPDVDAINKYGGYNFSYPCVAIIQGEADPWRSATPNKKGLPRPESTVEEPNLVIGGGAVHHWEQNGVFKNETTPELPPLPVKEAQSFEVDFVQAWLREWKETHSY
ncbi:putative extracellular serine carboxypeptidase 4 [Colletotrichum chlorophyti]|uniref:Putative extracellular serine carboxypeptidase 4 n=1 Tax=Colletotrichum chlorophyti TaxID=708187 RepID=A0A1Q8RC18_9PEZI|nr:putative extracellular serine carboxypeptidase 4 [Colletotrichum chlorophyti]